MSQENVEIVCRLYREWSRGNFRTPEFFAADVKAQWASEVPDHEADTGVSSFGAAWREWLRPWENAKILAEEFHPSGDQVLVLGRFQATGRASGIPVDQEVQHVLTVADGKVTSIRAYRQRAEAFEAVGLSG